MSCTTMLRMGHQARPSTEENSNFESTLDSLLDSFPEQIVIEGRFILRRERGYVSLQLIFDDSPPRMDSRIKRALDFIHMHYQDDISLSQIARSAYLSSSHFRRLFRRAMGMCCWEYIHSIRILRAKRLLGGTDLSLTQIAFDTGFRSLTHFGRVFKQIEGCPPSTYRDAILNSKKAICSGEQQFELR